MPGPRGTKWASRRAAPGLLGPALPCSSQSDAAVRGVCLALSCGPGLGGGVSGAVTSPRDPAGDVRGAARVVGARLARARVGGAGPGPRTLRSHDRGDGGGGSRLRPSWRLLPGALGPAEPQAECSLRCPGAGGHARGREPGVPCPGTVRWVDREGRGSVAHARGPGARVWRPTATGEGTR